MNINIILAGLLALVTAEVGNQGPTSARPDSVVLPQCVIALDEEAEVPAQEPGILLELNVKEGQIVEKSELLGRIDDVLPKMEARVAAVRLEASQKEADSDINVRYSKAAAEVAKAEYIQSYEANEQVKGAVPLAVMRTLSLKHKEAVLGIEKSEKEMVLAKMQVNVSQAEVDAAKSKVERRQLVSPLNGIVRRLDRHLGEWLQAGESVFHVVKMDRLRIDAFIRSSELSPAEVTGKPVSVKVVLARGQVETFSGKIIFVDPLSQAGGQYLVRAIVENRKENGQWLLQPGLNAEMTIQLN